MMGAFRWLKREVTEIFPAVAFFIVAFNLIVLTDNLTARQYGIRLFSFVSATVAAIVVGKVVLLTNLLPFMNVLQGRPFIYSALWKTALYMCAYLIIRYLEA